MAWKKADQLTGKQAKEALSRIHEFFYSDMDRIGDFWNPDKEVSGGDFVEHCALIFEEFGMVPEGIERPYAQWKAKCPKCSAEALIVREAILRATGETIYPGSPLAPDGFDVDPAGKFPNLKDMSTEDEEVMCLKCKTEFDLSELALA